MVQSFRCSPTCSHASPKPDLIKAALTADGLDFLSTEPSPSCVSCSTMSRTMLKFPRVKSAGDAFHNTIVGSQVVAKRLLGFRSRLTSVS